MGNAGHDGIYFARELDGAIERRDLRMVRIYAAGTGRVTLDRALEILDVIREKRPDLYDRAVAKWVGRLACEREVSRYDLAAALAALDTQFGGEIDRATLGRLLARPAT